jgi:ABC-type antimicrobial peptide transport system permease subunit
MLPLDSLNFTPLTNPACLIFTGLLAVGTGILFGLVPAVASTRVNLSPILRGTDAGQGGGRQLHIGGVLVVAQIALSLTLLVAAGLLVQSLRQLHRAEPGFDADHVVAAYVYPVLLGGSHAREMRDYQQMLDRLAAVPGVRSASVMRYWIGSTTNLVGPGFFATLGVPFIRGRDFSAALDSPASQKVAILSASAARAIFGNDDPIGRVVPSGDFAGAQVVGVVRDIRHSAWQDHGDATVYAPYQQADSSALGQIQLMVRTTGDAARSFAAMRAAVRSVEPDLPIVSMQTVTDIFGQSVTAEKSTARLLTSFGALALLLALVGLYGTVSHSVARRTREIGIRMSLGAAAADVVRSILGETLRLVAIGVVVGIGLAMGTSHLIGSFLYRTAPTDPIALASVIVLTVAVGLLAGSIPAYRAARVSPMVALRQS